MIAIIKSSKYNFDENNNTKNSYDFHIQKIRNFFNILLPELRYTELNLLIRELEKTYTNFKINRETDFTKLNNKDYPILNDLYKTIKDSFSSIYKDDDYYSTYRVILDFIRELTSGIYSKMFNNL